jgi:hypothetical protein
MHLFLTKLIFGFATLATSVVFVFLIIVLLRAIFNIFCRKIYLSSLFKLCVVAAIFFISYLLGHQIY